MKPVRVLVLAPFPPRLDGTHGGSRAAAELLVRLSVRHQVVLLCLRAPGEPAVDEALHRNCVRVREVLHSPPMHGLGRQLARVREGAALVQGTPLWVSRTRSAAFSAAVRETVAEWSPQVIQMEYHVMGQYLQAIGGSSARRVLRQYDPGFAAASEHAALQRGLGRMIANLDRWAWRRFEHWLMQRVHAVVVLTERDERVLAAIDGTCRMVRIPLGVAIPSRPSEPQNENPSRLLFIGSFIHYPNEDAAERLVNRILPLVKSEYPLAQLEIVGASPPKHLAARDAEGVLFRGEVPDTRVYLDSAAVFVAPLRLGGGMRVKVVEALALGKAVVASRLATEGLGVTDRDQLLLAETDEEFAQAILMLLRDPAMRAEVGARARQWAATELDWDRPAAAFDRLYGSLLD